MSRDQQDRSLQPSFFTFDYTSTTAMGDAQMDVDDEDEDEEPCQGKDRNSALLTLSILVPSLKCRRVVLFSSPTCSAASGTLK